MKEVLKVQKQEQAVLALDDFRYVNEQDVTIDSSSFSLNQTDTEMEDKNLVVMSKIKSDRISKRWLVLIYGLSLFLFLILLLYLFVIIFN